MDMEYPEAVARAFVDAFNSGDAVMALYEPQATLVPQPGTSPRALW